MLSVRKDKASCSMADIASVGSAHPGQLAPPSRGGSPETIEVKPGAAPQRPGDRVELSDHARYLEQLQSLPSVRQQRIADLRQAIADGSYETPQRLGAAIDRMIDEIRE